MQLPGEPLKPLLDWGLRHDPDWLLKRYKWFRKTNQYPNGKAMDEQFKSLLDDFDTLDYLIDWHKQKLLREKHSNGE